MSAAVEPPRDEAELLARARALGGRTLGELAARFEVQVPESPARGKGWAGALLERALGSTAGSRAEADFPALGIELKSLPVSAEGRVLETTFVTTLELDGPRARDWAHSRARHKLARVLFIPVEAERTVPLAQRRIGMAFLFSPDAEQESRLAEDFALLVELATEGLFHRIDASQGRWLHLRPKGADSSALRWLHDDEAGLVRESLRAFYLRREFTQGLLDRALGRG